MHPDDTHLLNDWALYGPRDPRIFELVEALAQRGARVEAVEHWIVELLQARLAAL